MRKVAIIRGGSSRDDSDDHSDFKQGEVVVLEHIDASGKKFFRRGTDDAILQILIRIEAVITLITNHFHGRSLKFNAEQIIKLFEELGVYAKNRNGYTCPYSDQASSVTEALKMELERLQIDVRLQKQNARIFSLVKGLLFRLLKTGKRGKYMRIM